MQIEGVFIVSGATKGLGFAVAEKAASNGFPVALIARSKSELMQAKALIEKNHPKHNLISYHAVDLSNYQETSMIVNEIIKLHGNIQVVVNNAATWIIRKQTEQLIRNDVEEALNLNFYPAFNLTTICLKNKTLFKNAYMNIVNIGATASTRGSKNLFQFCLGKGALRIFSQSLARDLAPQKIHVSHLIIDGLINNHRTRKMNPELPETRFMSPKSIAQKIIDIAKEDESCWTFECDLRPFSAEW